MNQRNISYKDMILGSQHKVDNKKLGVCQIESNLLDCTVYKIFTDSLSKE